MVNATDYICRHWNDPNDDPGWRPNNYHAMYTTMKGLTSLDIHDICGYDWQAEFEDAIVAQQNDNGSWTGCLWGDPILCTEWALLTLQKAAPPPRPATSSSSSTDTNRIDSASRIAFGDRCDMYIFLFVIE